MERAMQNGPAGAPAERWLGIELGGGLHALPLRAVRAVLHEPRKQPWPVEGNVYSIVIHEGAPIFVVAASEVLQGLPSTPDDEDAPWIVVIEEGDAAAVAIHARRIAGPLTVQPDASGMINHQGQSWRVQSRLAPVGRKSA